VREPWLGSMKVLNGQEKRGCSFLGGVKQNLKDCIRKVTWKERGGFFCLLRNKVEWNPLVVPSRGKRKTITDQGVGRGRSIKDRGGGGYQWVRPGLLGEKGGFRKKDFGIVRPDIFQRWT